MNFIIFKVMQPPPLTLEHCHHRKKKPIPISSVCSFDRCNVSRKDVPNFTSNLRRVSAYVVYGLFGPHSFPDCKSLMRIRHRPDSSFNFSTVFFKVFYNKYLMSKIINNIEMSLKSLISVILSLIFISFLIFT